MNKHIKFRVWEVINPPNDPWYTDVKSPKAGANYIEEESKKQRFNPLIIANAFGLEVDEGSGWEEWYNENGEDVTEAFNL